MPTKLCLTRKITEARQRVSLATLAGATHALMWVGKCMQHAARNPACPSRLDFGGGSQHRMKERTRLKMRPSAC